MKIFIDTEFTGLQKDTTLISVGLITECGKTFYAELNDYDESQCDNWIKENVIANLKFAPPLKEQDEYFSWSKDKVELRGSKKDVARYLTDWFSSLLGGPMSWVEYQEDCKPEIGEYEQIKIWSDCLAYDWVLFNDLFGHAFNIPKWVSYIPLDICTLFEIKGIDPDTNREEFAFGDTKNEHVIEKHNSLFDAKVIKMSYDKLIKL